MTTTGRSASSGISRQVRSKLQPSRTGICAIIVANVVHLFPPQRNRELLWRIRQAAEPGGRLLLVDFWTDPTHTRPLPAALLAGEFLIIAGEGDVYSQDELSEWLATTGWRHVEDGT
jgi:hypothetical protein